MSGAVELELLRFGLTVLGGILVAIAGFLIQRQLKQMLDAQKATTDAISNLDGISVGSWRGDLEQRITALAEAPSTALAAKLTADRALQQVSQLTATMTHVIEWIEAVEAQRGKPDDVLESDQVSG